MGARAVGQVGVVGAGFMGSGIAEAVARAGIPVTLHEPDAAALERSRERIRVSLEHAVAGGKLDEPGRPGCSTASRGARRSTR